MQGPGSGSSLGTWIHISVFMWDLLWIIDAGKDWRGRLVQWVETASLEKIRRLLEVSEQELHCEVLLTLKNLADVRQIPNPYSLSIIPRSLPLEIVEGEHFITSDLLSLLEGRAPPTCDPEAKASHQEQDSRASPASSTPTSRDSNSASRGPSWGERGIRSTRLPPLRKGTGSASRVP